MPPPACLAIFVRQREQTQDSPYQYQSAERQSRVQERCNASTELKHKAVIIRDTSRNNSRPLAYGGARDRELRSRERRRGNRILDVSEYRINRQAQIRRSVAWFSEPV
jgi:hypothetical protein